LDGLKSIGLAARVFVQCAKYTCLVALHVCYFGPRTTPPMIKRSIISTFRYPAIRAVALVSCVLPLRGQEPVVPDGVPLSVVVSDYQHLMKDVVYTGLAEGWTGGTNKSSSETKQGVALVVARTQLREIDEELLNKLTEQFVAKYHSPNLKPVTLADLTANSNEAKAGTTLKGTIQDFSNNQTVLNEAVNRGIPMVLFVDLTHFNGKAVTVPGANGLSMLSARASLTLLNAADGNRIKSVDREIKVRGFDSSDLTDKAFDLLAKEISMEAGRWRLPELQIKFHQVEVHAKMDGIQFPMMEVDQASGEIRLQEVPLFAEGASVEIDGVLKGTAPCRIDVAPGTHRLKVYRDGTKPYEATIQANASNRYDALLVPTEETRRRFDEQLRKFEAMKTMALNRNVQLEKERIKADGLRVSNANADRIGKASADLVQSRADVGRADADSRGTVARGKAAVLQGKAAILNEAAKEQGNLLAAEADATRMGADGKLQKDLAKADAIRNDSEGRLQIASANAREGVPIMNAKLEAMKEQVSVLKSFSESLAALGFKLALDSRQR
jgi:hypothetical protein